MPQKYRAIIVCLLLAVITLAVYWPATHFDFTNYDDPEYVIYNSPIQHGFTRAALAWSLQTTYASNWHPLTWLSHLADCSLYGLKPGGHHLTSLVFHAANAALVFLVLLQLTGAPWRSALVAALFAWHPLHVESVAWVSERKDVLSAFFWLLTISAYARYAGGFKVQGSRFKVFYGLALVFFICALMAKPMVVTLPFVLLLLDLWPLRRSSVTGGKISWRILILEKLPFVALALLDCLMTFRAQQQANSVVSAGALPFSERLATALVGYVRYLAKTIWPANLALPYPYENHGILPVAGAGLLLAAISVAVVWQLPRRPHLFTGWFWFLGTLVPVIGLVQVGIQSLADRYTYLPLLGIFIMLAWSIPASWTAWPRPGFTFGAVVAAVLLFLLMGTEVQLSYWRNSVTLFTHTVAVTHDNILAEYNLGEALARAGDEDNAIVHYQNALALRPNRVEAQYNSQPQARYNLGLIYRTRKNWPQAEAQFRACVKEDPNLARAWHNLAIALIGQNHDDEAKAAFQNSDRLDEKRRSEAESLAELDAAYAEAGRYQEAFAIAKNARDSALIHGRLDLAKSAEGRMQRYREQGKL